MWSFRCGHSVTVLVILWLAVSHSGGVTYNCDPGWRYFEGSCYLFSLVSHNWMGGRHDCRSRYTDLAKVQAASTNAFFAGRQTSELRKSPLWIGLNDRQRPGTFVWSDGTALGGDAYSNWLVSRPEDAPAGRCVELYGSAAAETEVVGQWVPTLCGASNKLPVCQSLPMQDPWERDHRDCGPGWVLDPDTDLCFLLQPSALPWDQARDSCVRSGAHLATVLSAPQQLFLNRLAGRLGVRDNTWVGARGFRNGSLEWSSGLPNAFTNFHPHESLPDVEGRCLSMKTGDATSFWDAQSCSVSRPSLCQKPASQANRCGADGTWKVFTNVCYKVFPNQTWQAASTACTGQSGQLAMVKTQPHFDFVFDLLRQFYGQLPGYNGSEALGWLGLTLATTDGGSRTFQWVDGTPLDDSMQYWSPSFNFTQRASLATLQSQGASCVGVDVTPYVRKTEAFRQPRPCTAALPFVCQKSPTFERPPLRGTGPIDESQLPSTTPPYEPPTRPTEQVFVPGGQSHSAAVGSIVGPIVGALVIIAIVVGVSVFLKLYLPTLPENHVIRRSIRRLSTRMRRSGRRQMQSPYSQSFVELSAVSQDSEGSNDPPATTHTSGQPPLKPARNGGPPSQNGGPRRGPRGWGPRGARDGPVGNGDVTSASHVGGEGRDVTAGRPQQGPPPAAEARGRPDPDRKSDPYYNQGPLGAAAQRSPDDVKPPRGGPGSGDGSRTPRGADPSDVTLSPSYLPADVRTSPSYLPPDTRGRPGDVAASRGYAPPDVRGRPGDVRTPRGSAPDDVITPYPDVAADVRGRDLRAPPRHTRPPSDVRAQRGPGDVRRQEGPGDRRPDPYYNLGPPDPARQRDRGDPRAPQGAQAAGGPGRMPPGAGPYDVRGPPGEVRARPGDVRGPSGDVRGRPGDVRGPPGDVRGPPGNVRGPPSDVRGRPYDARSPPGDVRGPPSDVRGGYGDARSPRGDVRSPPGDVRGPPRDVRGPPSDVRGGAGRPPNVGGPDPRAGPSGAGYGNVGGPGRYDGPPRSQNV